MAALAEHCLDNYGHRGTDGVEALLHLDEQVRAAAQVWVRNHYHVLKH